jgi:hypothetical protein
MLIDRVREQKGSRRALIHLNAVVAGALPGEREEKRDESKRRDGQGRCDDDA